MIVVTGGAGFIGSAIIWRLNSLNQKNIMVVDEIDTDEKWKNLCGLKFDDFINKNNFIELLETKLKHGISAIIHMGAISSTTEKDADFLLKNNYEYTKKLAEFCVRTNARFIYASSAATYGSGEKGFNDSEAEMGSLRPLNMYGYSKHLFDQWALRENLF